jgi:putative ABC transport system substrate-binding protein
MRYLRLGTLFAAALGAGAASAADGAVLKSADSPAWRVTLDALRRAAASHNVTEFDLRGDRAEADRVVASLKGKPGVLVALGPIAAQAAREGAPESPLVFCMVQDPARLGLVGVPNVTGVAFAIPIKNQLAAFRLVNPRGVKVGVVYNDGNVGRLVDDAQKAAAVVRLNLVARPVASEKEVPEALRSLLKGDGAVDALWIPPDPVLLGDESRRYVLAETLKAGKPVYSFSSTLVTEGALVSNGPDLASIGDQAGELVNRIAAGERGKIEMLVPRAELVVNKKIADKLKIEIPADALRAANKVL